MMQILTLNATLMVEIVVSTQLQCVMIVIVYMVKKKFIITSLVNQKFFYVGNLTIASYDYW